MHNRRIELFVGIFILAGLIAFAAMAFKVSGIGPMALAQTYEVSATFDNIGDLKVRAPVTVAGVRIGEVSKIILDPVTLTAKVKMQLKAKQQFIPRTTSAQILTQGVLGSNYIGLTPGFAEEDDAADDSKSKPRYLRQGSVIEETQSALILENLVGQLIYNMKK